VTYRDDNPRFKQVTVQNWLKPDPVMAHLVNSNVRDGTTCSVNGSDWNQFVNDLPIPPQVPQDVRTAFEFATGAIGYSYFYYPLFAIVAQQVLRVADFAVDKLLEGLAMKPIRSFKRRLMTLRAHGQLTDWQVNRWEALRMMRNEATHPAWHRNWETSMSLGLVRSVAEAISDLPWPKDT
jgi:hypothetical protein